jgi:NADH-quinone oxidoreductase subunit J
MSIAFLILAGLVLVSAMAAVLLPKLVHSVLCLSLTFAGLAGLYLQLGAEFVGFAQILVYVGAVSILIVFAILLTRNSGGPAIVLASASWWIGVGIAGLVFACLVMGIFFSRIARTLPASPELTVRKIGDRLMADYVLPLQGVGLLLTAAMIGAVILAMSEKGLRNEDRN